MSWHHNWQNSCTSIPCVSAISGVQPGASTTFPPLQHVCLGLLPTWPHKWMDDIQGYHGWTNVTVQLEMSISGSLDNLRRTMPWENSDKRVMINSQRKRLPLWRTRCLRNIKDVFIYCKVRATLAELLTSHQEGLSLPFLSSDYLFTRAITSTDVTCLYLEVWMDVCSRNLSAISLCKYGLGLHHWPSVLSTTRGSARIFPFFGHVNPRGQK